MNEEKDRLYSAKEIFDARIESLRKESRTVTIRMPDELAAWLEETAADNCRSMSKQVIKILIEYQTEQQQQF